jgi:aspartyl-tRNA(Asn)/glutamyl-tRNA(Gln) amidotransferase subunit A
VAFPLGEKLADPVQMYLSDVCTLPVNIAGLPAVSVPCGFSQGLPVGMQLIGPHLSEETLLRLAYSYEQATEWHNARPPI